MAKYTVKFSCGHEGTVRLFGENAERERKIKYYEAYGICPECWAEKQNEENSEGCEEVKMTYRQYKTEYADCKTKKGSYNSEDKTIIVYVPA